MRAQDRHGRHDRAVRGQRHAGAAGDGGPALEAQLSGVNDIDFDAQGNVYLADTGNHRVRVVGTDGTIRTVVGTGERGYSGDGGPASVAQINGPSAVCLDAAGAIYICDFGNHCVRKVAADGTISTIAGTGKAGWGDPDGLPATKIKLFEPCGVAVDREGPRLHRRLGQLPDSHGAPDGTMVTVAGTGKRAYAGDGGPATEAQISIPDLIDIDPAGNIYVAEFRNHVIRKLSPGE